MATQEEIANLLSMLFTNLNNLDEIYYDMFINTTPMDVTLERYDENGILQTYILPNRAKDAQNILQGSGDPNGVTVGNVGALYLDISNIVLYFKSVGTDSYGWIKLLSTSNFRAGIEYLKPNGNASQLTNINVDNVSSGILDVPNGGTGVATISGIIKGNGVNQFTTAVPDVDYVYTPINYLTPNAINNGETNSNGVANILSAPGSGTATESVITPNMTSNSVDGYAVVGSIGYFDINNTALYYNGETGRLNFAAPFTVTGFNVGTGIGSYYCARSCTLSFYLNGSVVGTKTFNPYTSQGTTVMLDTPIYCDGVYNPYGSGSPWEGNGGQAQPGKQFIGYKTISVSTATNVYFNVGGTYKNMGISDCSHKSTILYAVDTLPISLTPISTTWNIFVGSDNTSVAYANTITRFKKAPTSPSTNDVWIDNSVEPNVQKKWSGTLWESFNKVYCGKAITNSSGYIESVVQPLFNDNGYDINENNLSIYVPSYKYDYANKISKTYGTTYTADTNGLIYVQIGLYTGASITGQIDSTQVLYLYNGTDGYIRFSQMYNVSKGQTWYISNTSDSLAIYWIPQVVSNV